MRSMKRYLLWTAAVEAILGGSLLQVAVAQPPVERGTVSGTVLDADTEVPVSNATIRLIPAEAEEGEQSGRGEVQAITDAQGRFTLEAEAGNYRLHVEAPGYEPRPDETMEVRPAPPLELRLQLQSIIPRLRKEVAALRAAWQERHAEEGEPTPPQQEVLGVLRELEQAIQERDAERALHLFSEDHFQRVDFGGEMPGEEFLDPTLVISADRYARWQDTLRQAVADGLQVKFVNPAATLRGEWAGAEAIVVVMQGRAGLAQVKQITFIREGGAWRIAGITFPLPDPPAASQESEVRRWIEEAENLGFRGNPEAALLLLEKVSYQFPGTATLRRALEETIHITQYRLRNPEREAEICRDLLHRCPRPPGLFYKPDVEQGGQFGIYVNYEAQATLADALYRLGHLEEAVQEYEECFAYFPPAAPEPLVQRVRERLDFIRRHDGPEREPLRFLAQERYQELLEQFPDSDLVDNALWGQAQQIGNAGNEEEALRWCQRILDEYPDGDVADEVLSAFAEMHSETLHLRDGQLVDGDPDLALQWYRKLVEQFPGSEGAQRAQKRIQEIENLRAEADKWWQRQAPEEAIRASAEGALAGLRSEPAESRQRAAEELGRRRVKEAEAALLPLLQDADAGVREAVAWALGKIGTEQALAPLRALLDDENKGIRTTVQRALLEIKYTGDVVERPYDCPIEWMGKPVISGRHLAMGRNGGPFVYEHQGLHTQGIEWIGKAFPQLRGVPATPGYMLTDRCSARYPAWSPEGTEVVFVATNWATGPQQEENPRQDLWVVPTGGGSERPLTTTGDVVGRPQWWPGQQVLFARQSPERL